MNLIEVSGGCQIIQTSIISAKLQSTRHHSTL